MFTINQITEAHAKVKSGADFPQYVQDLKALGLVAYDLHVADGHAEYFGAGDFRIGGPADYPALSVAQNGSVGELAQALKIHQGGGTDYPTFCREAAEAGVEKWVLDFTRMTCTYYDRQGNVLVTETIPAP